MYKCRKRARLIFSPKKPDLWEFDREYATFVSEEKTEVILVSISIRIV